MIKNIQKSKPNLTETKPAFPSESGKIKYIKSTTIDTKNQASDTLSTFFEKGICLFLISLNLLKRTNANIITSRYTNFVVKATSISQFKAIIGFKCLKESISSNAPRQTLFPVEGLE